MAAALMLKRSWLTSLVSCPFPLFHVHDVVSEESEDRPNLLNRFFFSLQP